MCCSRLRKKSRLQRSRAWVKVFLLSSLLVITAPPSSARVMSLHAAPKLPAPPPPAHVVQPGRGEAAQRRTPRPRRAVPAGRGGAEAGWGGDGPELRDADRQRWGVRCTQPRSVHEAKAGAASLVMKKARRRGGCGDSAGGGFREGGGGGQRRRCRLGEGGGAIRRLRQQGRRAAAEEATKAAAKAKVAAAALARARTK